MDVEQQSRRRAKCGQPPAAMVLRAFAFLMFCLQLAPSG